MKYLKVIAAVLLALLILTMGFVLLMDFRASRQESRQTLVR